MFATIFIDIYLFIFHGFENNLACNQHLTPSSGRPTQWTIQPKAAFSDLLGSALLGLPERPADRKDKTTQPSTAHSGECETELIREKCSICETKILFGVLCFKCSRNYGLVVFKLHNAELMGGPHSGLSSGRRHSETC